MEELVDGFSIRVQTQQLVDLCLYCATAKILFSNKRVRLINLYVTINKTLSPTLAR